MKLEVYFDEHPGVRESVMEDMRERLGYDADDTTHDKEILSMSGEDFFREYMEWHGILGYMDTIFEAIYMAYGIDLESEPFDRDVERSVW